MSQTWRIQGKKLTAAFCFCNKGCGCDKYKMALQFRYVKKNKEQIKQKDSLISPLWKFVSERKAEEQRLAGGGQLHPRAGWPGDGVGPGSSQHRGRHPQDGADYQEYPGAAARSSGEQTRQVSYVSKGSLSFFVLFLTAQGYILDQRPLLGVVPYPSPTVFPCRHRPWPLTLSRCYDSALCRRVPAPTASPSPPMEQTVWAKRRCASSQAQPRMFQHAGALGWEGPSSPAAPQPPVPWPRLLVLWPLSLPPRHSFLFLSVTKHPIHPLCLRPPLLTSLPCGVPCSRSLAFYSSMSCFCATTHKSAHLCTVLDHIGIRCLMLTHLRVGYRFCGVAQLSTYSAN